MVRPVRVMMRAVALALACAAVTIGAGASSASDVERSILEAALPPFAIGPDQPAGRLAAGTQVMRRAHALGLSFDGVLALTRSAETEMARLRAIGTEPGRLSFFGGGRLSDLAALVAPDTRIVVTAPALIVDAPLRVEAPGVAIEFGGARLIAAAPGPAADRPEAAIQVRAEGVALSGGVFVGVEAVLVRDSRSVAIRDMRILDAPGYGVVVGPSNVDVLVAHNRVERAAASGVAVMERSRNVLVEHNEISDGRGGSNQHAAILVTDRRLYDRIGGPDFLLERDMRYPAERVHHGVKSDPILNRTPPRPVYVVGNTMRGNHSSGLYLDGAANALVRGNRIADNGKEGICLDNGATANIVTANDVSGNGRRSDVSDREMALDFIAQFGRMADGTPKAKVPAISIDNAVFNAVLANRIAGNHGSGVKMVRTAFFNLVGRNAIEGNNLGANDVHFFFGVEIGGARADGPVPDLDFLPSAGNIVYGNEITGGHYSGIQFCSDCEPNDVFDNMIVRPQHWAIEQNKRDGRNVFTNNFSLAPSRNANLNGSFGRVLIGGEGRFD